MSRIVLDPDDVNQDRVITRPDGSVVELGTADRATLDDIARQLHLYRCVYASAIAEPAHADGVASGEVTVDEVSPLYLRVAQLHRRAREDRRSRRAASELDLGLLAQDRVWVSSSGAARDVGELTPSHRRNLLGWLERISDELSERWAAEGREPLPAADGTAWVTATPLYARLRALTDAETAREQAMDAARQQARRIHFERTGEWPDR